MMRFSRSKISDDIGSMFADGVGSIATGESLNFAGDHLKDLQESLAKINTTAVGQLQDVIGGIAVPAISTMFSDDIGSMFADNFGSIATGGSLNFAGDHLKDLQESLAKINTTAVGQLQDAIGGIAVPAISTMFSDDIGSMFADSFHARVWPALLDDLVAAAHVPVREDLDLSEVPTIAAFPDLDRIAKSALDAVSGAGLLDVYLPLIDSLRPPLDEADIESAIDRASETSSADEVNPFTELRGQIDDRILLAVFVVWAWPLLANIAVAGAATAARESVERLHTLGEVSTIPAVQGLLFLAEVIGLTAASAAGAVAAGKWIQQRSSTSEPVDE